MVPDRSAGCPLPGVFGDANVSVGVIGLVVAILLLMVVLLAVIVIEVTGEHRTNVHDRHEHRA
jgi:hypothetical protein